MTFTDKLATYFTAIQREATKPEPDHEKIARDATLALRMIRKEGK